MPFHNKYKMFVVDLLHEVELGVWKAIFTHLIRLLEHLGKDKVSELNRRWVCVVFVSEPFRGLLDHVGF